MAGFYPDVPARRIPWDRDGSIFARYNSAFTTFQNVLNAAARQAANDEGPLGGVAGATIGTSTNMGLVILCPSGTTWTIRAYYLASSDNGSGSVGIGAVQYSLDSTNGIDGAWSTFSASVVDRSPTTTELRTAITSVTPVAGIKAVRWSTTTGSTGTSGLSTWHLYGDYDSSNRLAVWHPTLDQELPAAFFDWGDQPRSNVVTRDLRIKNLSAQTANGVVLSKEALTELSPAVVPQLRFTTDGVVFTDTVAVGTLAPGAISSVITVRYSADPAAALSLGWQRMIAAAASFS